MELVFKFHIHYLWVLIFLCHILKGEAIENLPTDVLCFMQEEYGRIRETHCSEDSRSKTIVSEFKMLMDIPFAHVESQMTICFVPKAWF